MIGFSFHFVGISCNADMQLHSHPINLSFQTAKCGPREPRGTITLRMRLEMEDERTRLLSNFVLPESIYVNVGTKKDFEVVQQTVEGGVDMTNYSLVSTIIDICHILNAVGSPY